ncbi:unnamed protein product [Spirodela intermedia]|uniref:Uncharacterized protein n=1 Tax=Spirodela intermedia TaxID=51605 RepID=A0A7I8IFT6_SPIIN|nr:unnamed protein product [Spirodela intermedia]CAA6656501.1 unnamed protein product [Spirodela intermedia]
MAKGPRMGSRMLGFGVDSHMTGGCFVAVVERGGVGGALQLTSVLLSKECMAKVAVVEPMKAKTFAVGRSQSDIMTKRRTPSELRVFANAFILIFFFFFMISRQSNPCHNFILILSFFPLLMEVVLALIYSGNPIFTRLFDLARGHKKPESLRGPKYIDTRVDEVYTARKFGDKWRMPSEKEKTKDSALSIEKTDSDDARNSCTSGSAVLIGKSINDKTSHNLEKCSRNTFLTVKQLSLGDERVQGPPNIDMVTFNECSLDKALRGLTVREVIHNSAFSTEFSGKHGVPPSLSSRKFNSEFCLPGHKSPLDFTLKTALRLVSSSSVKWCHKLSASWVYSDAIQYHDAFDVCYTKALNTWTYPQSSLPSSVVSAMSFTSSQAVHTTQFVAMFVGGQFLEKKKRSINAYISQSTTGLRCSFSMPLCHSEAEQAAEDDLVELSEIENQSLGRIYIERRLFWLGQMLFSQQFFS